MRGRIGARGGSCGARIYRGMSGLVCYYGDIADGMLGQNT